MPDRTALDDPRARRRGHSLGDHFRTQKLPERGYLGPGRLVARSILIREHCRPELTPPAEVCGVPRGQLPDEDEAGARRLDLLPCAIQLDRVRLAIDSAVVAKPHERHGALAPELAEPHFVAVVIEQHQVRERVGALWRIRPLAG